MKFKQQDLALIAAGLIGGLVIAFVANKYLFTNSASQDTTVDVVPVIHTDFPSPPSAYFNSQAIDPTQIINIAPNNSQQPFNSNQ
jgi:hypothetical protein